MPFVILSIGRDLSLLKRRNATLLDAGYVVVPAVGAPEAVDKFFNGDFDLVLLCHSLGNERRRLADVFGLYSPSTPVILISDMRGQVYDFGTATVNGVPDEIVGFVKRVLTNSASHRAIA